jgi:ADP-ribosylglycohydrolase
LEAAAAGALMVALALQDVEPEPMFEEIRRRCCSAPGDFTEVWNKVPQYRLEPPEVALAEAGLGEGWVGDEAVASAMYCYWRNPNDYSSAILTAVNTDGDSDSIATITGSVLGARLGLDSIPAKWRSEVEDSAYLHDLGQRLWLASRHHRG